MTQLPIPFRGLALAACLFALSGCAGDSSPSPSEPSGSIGLPSPTASGGATDLPADSPGPMAEGDFLVGNMARLSTEDLKGMYPPEMFEDTEEGAFLTALVYVDQISKGFETRDASVLWSLADTSCGWCEGRYSLVMDSASLNLRITGGKYLLSEQFFGESTEHGTVAVAFPATREEIVIWNPDGSVHERTPAAEVVMNMELKYQDDRWLVIGIAETS